MTQQTELTVSDSMPVPPRPEIRHPNLEDLFLPEPDPVEAKYTIISVDDHVLEPPHAFEGRLPTHLRDEAPRVVETKDGHQAWLFDGELHYEWGDSAVVGRQKDLVMKVPFRYEYLRAGCYDSDARIHDLDLSGTYATLNFPSFVTGFCGRVMAKATNPELGKETVKAWNDWYHEEWYTPHPTRIIPQQIVYLADPQEGAREIYRNAERGFRAVSMPERPHRIGLPSIFNEYWDPIIKACAETDTVINLHIGSTGVHEPPPDASESEALNLITVLFGQLSMHSCAEWLVSPWPRRYPGLKIAQSEGGIGWVAMILDRLDNLMDRSPHTQTLGWSEMRPADVLRRNFWFCTLDDPSTIDTRHTIGVENIMVEMDYPHGDGTWPHTQNLLEEVWGHLPNAEMRAICSENAAKLYRHPLPDVVLPLD